MVKKVLVTGGASGIGLEISRAFLQKDYQVIISDLNEELGEEKSKDLGCQFIKADLSVSASVHQMCDELLALGGVDIIVNNAGFQHVAPIEEFPEETWNKMIQVMLTSPFLIVNRLFKVMKENHFGRIINMGSIHSHIASPFKSAYISAKHGLFGLTKTIAMEGGEFGITSNLICPAYVKTPLVDKQVTAQAKHLNISEEEVLTSVFLQQTAIKKMIEPEEVASLCLYLASEQAKSITGSAFNIDCGWLAH